MGPPRRRFQAVVEETLTPPSQLQDGQMIARVKNAAGNNLYTVESPSSQTFLVELEAKFRSKIWLKRGSYVVVDEKTLADRDNKIDGEIVNIIREEKNWMKQSYWPKEFVKRVQVDSDEEDSVVGKLPPSSSDED